MNTRETVRYAWQLTQTHLKKLIWYAAIPSFFVIIVSSVYLGYQYNALKDSELFSQEPHNVLETVGMVWGLVSDHVGLSIALVIAAIVVVLGYILLPPMFRGVLIQALERIRKHQDLKGSVEVGIRHFFPMFEYGLLTGAFGITTLFTESSFILRWWGEDAFFFALPILLFIAMVGLVVSFLFTYAEYYIVLEDKGIMRAIMDSAVLVIANLRRTFLIFVLMLLIGVRIILNVILVLLIPMVVVALATYFSSIFLTPIGLILIGVFAFAILLVSAYLLGLFNIFATAVWVLTFGVLRGDDEQPVRVLRDEEVEVVEDRELLEVE